MKTKEAKISDLIPDDKNLNKGNPFGESLIEKSFQKFGAGRSILLDKNNNIIAGNKSTQKFSDGGGEKVLIIETTGDTLVAVKRMDIDIDSKQGREMALADNASAKANIEWDMPVLEEIATEWEITPSEWGITDDFAPSEEELTEEKKPSSGWFLNISFDSETECESWYNKLIAEGLNCKIIQ